MRALALVFVLAGCAVEVGTEPLPGSNPGGASAPDVLRLHGVSRAGDGWLCSGTAIHDGRTIATAAHCFGEHSDYPGVRVQDSHGRKARTIDCWRPEDGADLVYCDVDAAFPPVEVTHEPLPHGMPIYTAGWGCERSELARHAGWHSWTDDGRWGSRQMSPEVCGGDSGGPMYTADGRVFGIVTHTLLDMARGVRL